MSSCDKDLDNTEEITANNIVISDSSTPFVTQNSSGNNVFSVNTNTGSTVHHYLSDKSRSTNLEFRREDLALGGDIYIDSSRNLNIRNLSGSGDLILQYTNNVGSSTIVRPSSVSAGTQTANAFVVLRPNGTSYDNAFRVNNSANTIELNTAVQYVYNTSPATDSGLTIPAKTTCYQITAGSETGAFSLIGPTAVQGQTLYVRNDSSQATTGLVVASNGGSIFFYNGSSWLLVGNST